MKGAVSLCNECLSASSSAAPPSIPAFGEVVAFINASRRAGACQYCGGPPDNPTEREDSQQWIAKLACGEVKTADLLKAGVAMEWTCHPCHEEALRYRLQWFEKALPDVSFENAPVTGDVKQDALERLLRYLAELMKGEHQNLLSRVALYLTPEEEDRHMRQWVRQRTLRRDDTSSN
ncbi:MAG TPA: hypothetical protein VG796_07910 [Verrucomicrobiales bacterium]|nr:hypothetical protein [Verrucomicrobiales bacterium]